MSEDTYNGWKNYPTWNVNLWLENDEGLSAHVREIIEEASDYEINNRDLRGSVADSLKDWVRDELAPDLGASFAADLLGYALDKVDWYEIATSWLNED